MNVALDPLQNLLHCIYIVLECRKRSEYRIENEHRLIGEMDYLEEIHRQLKELGLCQK